MAHYISHSGVASVNLTDRISALPFRHHAMAFGFRYNAADRVFVPATRELTVFERGIDDTCARPYVGAGYSTPSVPDNSVDITNVYKGGAFSITDPVQLLSIAVVPSGTVRIVRAESADVKHAGTPAFPRDGGTITSLREQHDDFWNATFDDFWSAASFASQAHALPPGNNTICSLYVGLVRFMREKDRASRPNSPRGYFRFGDHVFAEPNLRNASDFNPNRIRFTFGESPSIALRDGLAAPADGDFAVLDMDVRVETARVVFSKAGDSYEGVDETDKRKIAAWCEAIKADIDPSAPTPRSPFAVDPRVIAASQAAAGFQRALAAIAAGESDASIRTVATEYTASLVSIVCDE